MNSLPETDKSIELTHRERAILRSIVYNYILTANPVGSRALSKRFHLELSPATIRNTMSDLEEQGLLSHPHTSAGRVPTDLGYRIYVDGLMEVEEVSPEVRKVIKERMDTYSAEVNTLLDQVGEILAEVTRLLTVITAPHMTMGELQKIELIRVAAGRIMAVIVVSSGLVKTINLEFKSDISDQEIASAQQLINMRLVGLKLMDIPTQMKKRLTGENCTRNAIVRLLLDLPDRIFTEESLTNIHIGGARNVLDQPEYNSPEKLKGIIELIENRDVIVHLLKERAPGVSVTIGRENLGEQFQDFSVITSTYRMGEIYGTLGIIGPTRMHYSRLVSIVDYTSRLISELLVERASQE